MNFVALNFETTNADLSSICQVGLDSFRDGEVAETLTTLVDADDYFDPIDTSIHGIDEDRVRGASRFHEIYSQLSERVSGAVVVCHTLFHRAARACIQLTCMWSHPGQGSNRKRIGARTLPATVWWEHFRLAALDEDELFDDRAAIAGEESNQRKGSVDLAISPPYPAALSRA